MSEKLKSAKEHIKGFMNGLPKNTKVFHHFEEEDLGHVISTYEFKYKRKYESVRKVTITIEEVC